MQKGFAPITLIFIVGIIALLVLACMFVAMPFRVSGTPVPPFVSGQQVFGERISYWFKNPKVGDRVIFKPREDNGMNLIGVIVEIKNDNNVTSYVVKGGNVSGQSNPWIISKDRITSKIWYPVLSNKEVLEAAVQPIITPQPSPTSDETANWKVYTNTKYNFQLKYPNDWEVGVQSNNENNIYFGLSGGDSIVPNTGEFMITINEFSNPSKQTNYSVAGIAVFKEEMSGEQNPPAIWIYFSYKGNNYTMVMNLIHANNRIILDKIIPTFKFTDNSVQAVPTSVPSPVQNGADLEGIKYTLRPGWKTEIASDSLTGRSLRISPGTGPGLLVIHAYDYPSNIGRREYYCKVTNYCIEGTTYYTQMRIGNISGYEANALDNSGGGSEYFGAKGNRFYILSKIRDITSETDEFNTHFREVLNSLVF